MTEGAGAAEAAFLPGPRYAEEDRGSDPGRQVERSSDALDRDAMQERRLAAPSGPGSSRRRSASGRRAEIGRRGAGPYFAALDLGTNNCRLLIAEPRDGNFQVVDSFSRIVRLGEGVAQTGLLGQEAMERALAALYICRQKVASREVAAARLIATEACRRAANGAEFLARVREEVGLDLEIIDRRTEARLAVAGCSALMDPRSEGALLFDIGGGSTEIVWLDRRRTKRRRSLMRAWASLPVGVVTLSEEFGGIHVDESVFEAMVAHVRSSFDQFQARRALAEAVAKGRLHYLGTSGTVTTLAGVHLKLPRYNRRQVDGLWLEDGDVGALMRSFVAMPYEERVRNPCIGRERADLVLAGCAIFEAIRREWPCGRLRVADRGLREGILVQLMRNHGFLTGRPS